MIEREATLSLAGRSWPVLPLKRFIRSIESGVSVNAVDLPAQEGEYGVLKTSAVYSGTFEPGENKRVVADELDRVACPVRTGTLIVSRMNTPGLVGAAAAVRTAAPGIYLPDRLWQVEFSGLDSRFVDYWTKTELYRAQVRAACAGTSASMQNLSQEDFTGFVLRRPPLEWQRDAVRYLDRETARIDALIDKKTRFIELLREKRQALITQAVTRGLDPSAPMKESGVKWLGRVPAHWAVKPLKWLVKPGASVTYGIVQPGDNQSDGVPFVQTTNMSSGDFSLDRLQRTTSEIAAAYPRSQLVGGEVILGIRASIGAAHIVPPFLKGANISRGVARVDCVADLLPQYLVWFLRSRAAVDYWGLSKQGSTFNEVSIETVRKLPVVVPGPTEQQQIVAMLNEAEATNVALEEACVRSIELLRERRSSLITAAVTGQIDLREAA